MMKKLLLLLSLVLVPTVFATSVIYSTGTGETRDISQCIYNLCGKCPYTENCVYGNRTYRGIDNSEDNVVCPYYCPRKNYRYCCGNCYKRMCRGLFYR